MNIFNKIRKSCRIFRIIIGIVIIGLGFYFNSEEEIYNLWFALGAIPLLAGITNFCPLCMITKRCSI